MIDPSSLYKVEVTFRRSDVRLEKSEPRSRLNEEKVDRIAMEMNPAFHQMLPNLFGCCFFTVLLPYTAYVLFKI